MNINDIPTPVLVIAIVMAVSALFMIGAAINDWIDGW
jgi:hypothetical protein